MLALEALVHFSVLRLDGDVIVRHAAQRLLNQKTRNAKRVEHKLIALLHATSRRRRRRRRENEKMR